jgi:hypothetical protein
LLEKVDYSFSANRLTIENQYLQANYISGDVILTLAFSGGANISFIIFMNSDSLPLLITIDGYAAKGETLRAEVEKDESIPDSAISYQWALKKQNAREFVFISGATQSFFTITDECVWGVVKVIVTVSGQNGGLVESQPTLQIKPAVLSVMISPQELSGDEIAVLPGMSVPLVCYGVYSGAGSESGKFPLENQDVIWSVESGDATVKAGGPSEIFAYLKVNTSANGGVYDAPIIIKAVLKASGQEVFSDSFEFRIRPVTITEENYNVSFASTSNGWITSEAAISFIMPQGFTEAYINDGLVQGEYKAYRSGTFTLFFRDGRIGGANGGITKSVDIVLNIDAVQPLISFKVIKSSLFSCILGVEARVGDSGISSLTVNGVSIDEFQVTLKKNGAYEFKLIDNAGREYITSYVIDNIFDVSFALDFVEKNAVNIIIIAAVTAVLVGAYVVLFVNPKKKNNNR